MNLSIWNFDIGLVLFYLLLTLGVGIWKGRGIKSFRDFAIGDSAISNTALTATITATWLSAASVIGSVERIYKFGIVWLVIFLGGVLAIYIFRRFTPKIIQFKGALSVAEILGIWYGKPARVIGGVCVTLHSIGMVAAQVAAIGFVFYELYGIPPELGIFISAGVVVIYSSFGGIKAVTVTDVIQFAFFMAATPIIAMIVIDPAGGYEGLYTKLPREHWHLFPSYGTPGEYIALFILFAVPFFDSCLIQRVLMARDKDQIMECFKATSISMIIFYVLSAATALSMRVIEPDLDPGNVLYYTINHYLPIGIKGLGVAGVLAAIMSTADSYLNVSSIAVIHDVIHPLSKRELSDKHQLLIVKATTFLIGIATIIVATSFDSVLQIVLKSWVVWAPIMVAPLYATFFGIRANSNMFLAGMTAGVATVIVWLILGTEAKTGIDSTVPSLFANLAAFSLVGFYYHKFAPHLLNNPTLPNPSDGKEDKTPSNRFSIKKLLRAALGKLSDHLKHPKKLLHLLLNMSDVAKFSSEKVEYFGAQYKLFAYFAFAVLVVPHLLWPGSENIMVYSYEVSVLLMLIGVGLIFTLLTYDSWPEKCQRYLPLYWHFTVMYCLVFFTTFLYLYHRGSMPWLVNAALSLLLLSILVDWVSFIVLTIVGIVLSGVFYDYLVLSKGVYNTFSQPDKIVLFAYVATFASTVGIFFSRNREYAQVVATNQKLKQALAIKTEILDNISHETRTPIQGVLTMAEFLEDDWDVMPEQKKFKLVKDLRFSAHRLMSFVHNLVDLSKYKVGKMEFELEPAHFRPLVDGVVKEAHIFYVPDRNIELKVNVAPGLKDYVSLDEYKMTKLLRNVVGNAFKYIEEGAITISLSNQDDQLLFCIEDEGVGIPDNELEEIFQPFIQSSRTKTGAGGTGVGLTIARDVAIGHGGKIWAENRVTKGAKFCLLLPLLPEQPRLEEGTQETKSSLRGAERRGNPGIELDGHASAEARHDGGKAAKARNDGVLKQEGESSNKPRVMIIDDEAVCHGALDMLLTEHCSEIICFTSAIKALAHLRNNPDAADLILLDVMMPGMTGLEFLEIIRSDPKLKHIKVMMQSGNFDQEVMQKTSQLGVSGYIPKPYDKVKVVEMVTRARR